MGWAASCLVACRPNNVFSSTKRPNWALMSTRPPIQRVPGALSRVWGGWCLKLTTHFHLVSKLKVIGAITSLRAQGQLF